MVTRLLDGVLCGQTSIGRGRWVKQGLHGEGAVVCGDSNGKV